jgi:hypothetical protein
MATSFGVQFSSFATWTFIPGAQGTRETLLLEVNDPQSGVVCYPAAALSR